MNKFKPGDLVRVSVVSPSGHKGGREYSFLGVIVNDMHITHDMVGMSASRPASVYKVMRLGTHLATYVCEDNMTKV